jgi:hypothetical protein
VADVAESIPGGDSATAAVGYALAWSSTFDSWHDQATRHSANLSRAAAGYVSTEQDQTQRFASGGPTPKAHR